MQVMKLGDNKTVVGKTMIVYAESGAGKTSLLGTLNGNTLLLDVEGGTSVLRNNDRISVVRIKEDLENLKETFDDLVTSDILEKLDIKTVCLDSSTELEKFMQIRLAKASNNSGMPTKHDYGVVSFRMRDYMRRLRDLRDRGINVIVTALEFPLELSSNEDETVTRLYPMMAAKLAPEVAGLFDIVAHLEVSTKPGHEGERFLRLDGNEKVLAKNRYGNAKFAIADLGRLFDEIDEHMAPVAPVAPVKETVPEVPEQKPATKTTAKKGGKANEI